uniref:Uncharacterized protein n=1 Tax=Arundo donax TaxID=35708 RepID=A0A0A9AUY3_ARUDO
MFFLLFFRENIFCCSFWIVIDSIVHFLQFYLFSLLSFLL